MTCTLDTLTLADVPEFGIAVGDVCSACWQPGDARLKVSTFLPVGRGLSLASEHRACPGCEQILIDAAHANVADQRHLVRTLRLDGHRDFNAGRALVVVCDTRAAA